MQDMSKKYNESPFRYFRRPTREVKVGSVGIGGKNPIRVQSMTNTDTKDISATLQQIRELAEAGSELVRITVPTTQDAEALPEIRRRMKLEGIEVPLVADIHFTPSIAMKAVEYVEKIRINPGNFADRKKFAQREYTDAEYQAELERIYASFSPLVRRAKELGVAMRIGTNHGSLSDRILNRYGDTVEGMVESALEFIRIAEDHSYRDIIVSMKASNTQIMVQAYRLLVQRFYLLGMDYPLHLGVTEAGDGLDGRIKSCIGIGSLLDDGLGDTIRVSLTEDPVLEIPVAKAIVERYNNASWNSSPPSSPKDPFLALQEFRNPFSYSRFYAREIQFGGQSNRETSWIGNKNPIRVEACFSQFPEDILQATSELIRFGFEQSCPPESLHFRIESPKDLKQLANLRKTESIPLPVSCILSAISLFQLSDLLASILDLDKWATYIPEFANESEERSFFQMVADFQKAGGCTEWILKAEDLPRLPAFLETIETWNLGNSLFSMESNDLVREYRGLASHLNCKTYPILLSYRADSYENALYSASIGFGGLLIDGIGDMIRLEIPKSVSSALSLSYGILQGSRLRLSRTEYISCPSCGRTQFDLQEVTQRIKSRTSHLKGVKIAVMGCIVNGPGEMADADFGYVGAAPGKVHLYKGKEIVLKNVPEEEAPDKLVQLIQEYGMWVEPESIGSLH